MQNQEINFSVLIVAVSLLLSISAYTFDMGKMMNPSKWMGCNKDWDRYNDYYGSPGYGYGGAPGYVYDYAPDYGAAPGYGYGGAPGYYAAPSYGGAPAYGAPGTGSNEAEVIRLNERIRQLEEGVR